MAAKHGKGAGRTQDRIARQLVDRCLRLQARCARWMGQKVNSLPKRTKLAFFMLFAGMAGGYSIYRIADGILTGQASVLPVAIAQERPSVRNPRVMASSDSLLATAACQRIRRFRIRMDSLENSPTGKRIFDSITAARPGLMDSVLFIEKKLRENTHQLRAK